MTKTRKLAMIEATVTVPVEELDSFLERVRQASREIGALDSAVTVEEVEGQSPPRVSVKTLPLN